MQEKHAFSSFWADKYFSTIATFLQFFVGQISPGIVQTNHDKDT